MEPDEEKNIAWMLPLNSFCPECTNNNNLYLLPLAIRITVIMITIKIQTLNIIYTNQIKLSLAPLGINECAFPNGCNVHCRVARG